jgi:DNA recombination protein RmuC
MIELLLGVLLLASALVIVLLVLLLRRPAGSGSGSVDAATVDAIVTGTRREFGEQQKRIRSEFELARTRADDNDRKQREEVARLAKESRDHLGMEQDKFRLAVGERLDGFGVRLNDLIESSGLRARELRESVEKRLDTLREGNEKKLDEMRVTVDEKLQGALEKRLGESFKLVSDRLEQVHKGLGDMQTLASGVGDLKKVLTNVKTRGTWGEVQLGMLLEQMLAPSQYESNVTVRPGGAERVEFAVRLPGREEDGTPVYLPIDSKFPIEDYQRLVEAQDAGDTVAVAAAAKELAVAVKGCAKTISEKYVHVPHTTDFAILFVPIEGLFAEIVRRPGLIEHCQANHRVTIAGPTTLTAMLNALQMGFRTLAIQKRSSEVWEVLGGVKSEFAKFGESLAKVKRKLEEASNSVGDAEVRSRAVQRKLKSVEGLPAAEGSAAHELTKRLLEEADDSDPS